jgi:hypothetical protein
MKIKEKEKQKTRKKEKKRKRKKKIKILKGASPRQYLPSSSSLSNTASASFTSFISSTSEGV